MKNLESYQQAVMLSLINNFCSFTIESPGKHSKVTVTTPRLVLMNINGQDIDVNTLALNQSQQIMKNELSSGLSQSTAMRRFEKNKKIFTENFLFDTCLEYGFLFESKPSRKSQKSQQLERIYHIYYNMKHLMDQNLLVKIGKELNDYFFSILEKEKRVTFKIKHDYISEILHKNGVTILDNKYEKDEVENIDGKVEMNIKNEIKESKHSIEMNNDNNIGDNINKENEINQIDEKNDMIIENQNDIPSKNEHNNDQEEKEKEISNENENK